MEPQGLADIVEPPQSIENKLWEDLAVSKPVLYILVPLASILAFHGWLLPPSASVFLVVFGFYFLLQRNERLHAASLERLSRRCRHRLLLSQQSTPSEPCSWLNQLILRVWANYLEPHGIRQLLAVVRRTLRERKPRFVRKVDMLEFSLGSAPPELGLQQTCWRTDANGVRNLRMSFKWDTEDISVILSAKMGFPLRGRSINITIHRLFIQGEVRIVPILDGQALVYSFENVPEVRLGISLGGGLPGSDALGKEVPGIRPWLERVFVDTLVRTMVEPRRRLFALPVVDLRKSAVSGRLAVTVVAARGLTRAVAHHSHVAMDRSRQPPLGGQVTGPKSNGHQGPIRQNSEDLRPISRTFVEFTIGGDWRKRTESVAGGASPCWGSQEEVVVHGPSGTLFLSVYEQGPGLQCKFLGACEIKFKYGKDDSTIFWAIGPGFSVVAVRAEFCGKEVALTVPLEGSPSGELDVRLCLNEWVFTDGSRAISNYRPPTGVVDPGRQAGMPLGHLTGRVIRVEAVEGRNLASADKARKSDPYLTLYYGKSMRRTKTVHQDLNPSWSQVFTFREREGADDCLLRIKCHDADILGDVSLGSARVNVNGMADGDSRDIWVPLEKIRSGEIRLRIEVVGAESRREGGSKSVGGVSSAELEEEEQEEAELDTELTSMDAPSAQSVLLVTLVEARDLARNDWGSKCDAYVSVRYGALRKRSKVVYKSTNPVWNQTLEFVEDGSPLVLFVKDHNTLKRSYAIGHCDVPLGGLSRASVAGPQVALEDMWLPLIGASSGEIHVQISRRAAAGDGPRLSTQPPSTKKGSNGASQTVSKVRAANLKLQRASGKVRMLIKKATLMADDAMEEGEGDNEEMRQLIEDLEAAEDEREALIYGLQKDRDLLVAKVKELESVMLELL